MARIRKISIALTADLHTLVQDAVATGRYGSVSEVIREALRDWRALRAPHADRPASAGAAPDALIQSVRPLCQRFGAQQFWVYGRELRHFAVEFTQDKNKTGVGQLALFQLELQFLLGEDATLLDFAAESDPSRIRYIESTRRRLYTAQP